MGQKIHPYGLRLGIVTDWKSRWYSEKDYAAQVNQDHEIRTYLRKELTRGAVSRIDIERIGTAKVQVDVHTARPGVVIGRGGGEAERLRTGLEKLTDKIVKFNVIEVQNAELDATLLARSVADQLEGRVAFRRAMKRAVSTALKAGAEGVRVQAKGRLGGADMGRREWYLEGRVPLHTLRADIDYGQATAATTVGAIGVQVWVYKGDILPSAAGSEDKIAAEARLAAGGPSERRRSAKSRAEAAAGEGGGRRLIEAGGGKRIVEAGGGKRTGGRRLIEAGGGRRLTSTDAKDEFEQAVEVSEETLPDGTAVAKPADTADVTESQTGASGATTTPSGSGSATEDAAVEGDETVTDAPSDESPVVEGVETMAEEMESVEPDGAALAEETTETVADADEAVETAEDAVTATATETSEATEADAPSADEAAAADEATGSDDTAAAGEGDADIVATSDEDI